MDSTINKAYATETEGVSTTVEISEMSPVTNLAFNLSSLTTSIAGTPARRISWSNPIPGGDKIGLNLEDLSPSNTDSPTFQDVLSYHGRPNYKRRRGNRKILVSDSEDEKENVAPKENVTPKSKMGTKSIPIGFEMDSNVYENEHHDSGYSSTSVTNKFSADSYKYSSSFTYQNCSTFAYNEEDSMESIFRLDAADESQDILAVPDMSSLLTKPLFNLLKSTQPPTPGIRKGKLPIRRCLSMEVEFDSEASPSTSQGTSKHGTYLSSSSSSNDPGMDLDENGKCPFKRPDPPNDYVDFQSKRRKSSPSLDSSSFHDNFRLQRSYSETATTIMHAILKSDMQPELIGDGSRSCVLPLVKGRHQDLKSISPKTLAQLLKGEFQEIDSHIIVDCRYPYEFEGGHIKGAINIFTKEDVIERFFADATEVHKRNVVIFHCEFSSERAPTLCRFLRNKDREMNEGNYPHLNHPEMYILEGGYKAFFESFKELCEPQTYKPMNHKDHGFELRHFRAKSKSWGAESKNRSQLRSNSKTSVI